MNNTDTNNNLTKFTTGAVRDTSSNKEDYIETTSWLAMQAYAKYMSDKAKTYGSGNWRKGIPVESYERSLMRHIQKYLANKYDDAKLEPNEDHLCAAMFNLMGLLHEREKTKLTDTPTNVVAEEVEVPKSDMSAVQARIVEQTNKIKELIAKGYTKEEVAKHMRIGLRTVFRRLNPLS